MSSNPTPERLLRSGGYFEEPTRGRAKILTFRDDGLGRLEMDHILSTAEAEIAGRFRKIWWNAGLAGFVPAINLDRSIVIGGDNFGGHPRTDWEMRNRVEYRRAVQHMGIQRSVVVEAVACWGHRVEHMEFVWPGALNRLRDGLEALRGLRPILNDCP